MNLESFIQKDILSYLEDIVRYGHREDKGSDDVLSDLLKPNQEEIKEEAPKAPEPTTAPTQIHADKIEIKQDLTGLPPPFPVDELKEKKIIAQVASEAAAKTVEKISEKKSIDEEVEKRTEKERQKLKEEHEKQLKELQEQEEKEKKKSRKVLGHVLKEKQKEKEELIAVKKKALEEKIAREEAEAKAKEAQEEVIAEKAWVELDEKARADEEKRAREEELREKIDDAIFLSQEEEELKAIADKKAKEAQAKLAEQEAKQAQEDAKRTKEEQEKAEAQRKKIEAEQEKAEAQAKAKEAEKKAKEAQEKAKALAKQQRLEEEKKKREEARKKVLAKQEVPLLQKIYKEEKALERAFEKKDYNESVRHYRRIKRDAPTLHYHAKEQNDLFVQLKYFAGRLPSLQEVHIEETSQSLPEQKDVSNVASKLVTGDFKNLYLSALKALKEKDKRSALQLLIALAKEHPNNLAVKIHLQEALAL